MSRFRTRWNEDDENAIGAKARLCGRPSRPVHLVAIRSALHLPTGRRPLSVNTHNLLRSKLNRQVLRALTRQLRPCALAYRNASRLGAAVPRQSRTSHDTRGRGDVDEGGGSTSLAGLAQRGDHDVHRVEDRLEVDVHAEVKVALGRLEHRLGLVCRARIVDDEVYAAERLLGRGERGLPIGALRDVTCGSVDGYSAGGRACSPARTYSGRRWPCRQLR